MADDRTTVTELITGLGMLGFERLDDALSARPEEMVSVSPEQWSRLEDLHDGGAYAQEFLAAWENGVAFYEARDGLRRRRPIRVEWRGGSRQPGDEPVPADLRVDHVFLVSCKYLSKIVTNSSPAAVFDRLLVGGHGTRSGDWYATVATDAYQDLYREVLEHAALVGELPDSVEALDPGHRARLKHALGKGRWPPGLQTAAARFSKAVSEASAQRWRDALEHTDPARVLWRLLRIGSAPYFVLGAASDNPLRLRIGTAWDWRQQYQLREFAVSPAPAGQPVVRWRVDVEDRRSRTLRTVDGHVEIRWSHGKFAQPPEAKVYLDTPHHQVPGYWPLA